MIPLIPARKHAVGRGRRRWLAWVWLALSSVFLLLVGTWLLIVVDDWWRKVFMVPVVLHGTFGMPGLFGYRPARKLFRISGALLVCGWFVGSFDSGIISIEEIASLTALVILVAFQYVALSRLAKGTFGH